MEEKIIEDFVVLKSVTLNNYEFCIDIDLIYYYEIFLGFFYSSWIFIFVYSYAQKGNLISGVI